jgi:signal transduction histidine kinase
MRSRSVRDGLIAVGLAALSLLMYSLVLLQQDESLPLPVVARDVAGALMMTLPLAWRRHHPVAVLVIAVLGGLVADGSNPFEHAGYAHLGLLVASCTVARHRDLRTSVPALLGLLLFVVVDVVLEPVSPDDSRTDGVVGATVLVGSAWAVGAVVRRRHERELTRRVDAEQAAWEQEQQAVADERARIARELHDVVAHHVSSMVVSAGAAHRVFAADPEGARSCLAFVAQTATDTTEAMHRLLGVLVSSDGPPSAPAADGAGLGDLDGLVERVRRAGCRVELRTGGDLAALPPDLDLSGYRIVQEALTNTLKHAGPVRVRVQVDRTPDALEIRVHDPGPRRPLITGQGPGAGHGLVGMRERVALFGGNLTAGPTAEGGWAVDATLPIGPLPTSDAGPSGGPGPTRGGQQDPPVS